MKKHLISMFLLCLSALIFALTTSAQTKPYSQGGKWRHNSEYERMYKIETVVTVPGTVVTIENVTSQNRAFQGVHLILRTQTEDLAVHLGPDWYVNSLPEQILVGDRVEVTGSRIQYEEEPAIIASKIVKNQQHYDFQRRQRLTFVAGQGSN